MIVLGIETTARRGSVGLVALDAGGAVESVHEASAPEDVRHGDALLSVVDECLQRAGRGIEEIGLIAVAVGPGSFTGLRLGLATAKGLAFAGQVPVVAVGSLDGLAAAALLAEPPSADDPIRLCACLDARKGEIYSAVFSPGPQEEGGVAPALELIAEPAALAPQAVVERLQALSEGHRLVLLGDGAARYEEGLAGLTGRVERRSPGAVRSTGDVVARLGAVRFARSGGSGIDTIAPMYVRASQAELSLGTPKRSTTQRA